MTAPRLNRRSWTSRMTTAGAASAIAEITQYNLYETLTKIGSDSQVTGLLAESWTASPDLKTWTFKLRKGVKFHNGEAFTSANVKFSFERAVTKESTNKDKPVFANMERIDTPDAHTVVLNLKNGNPDLLFQLGQATAILVDPKSAATNATQPVGTGPYRLEAWSRGSSVTLSRWDGYRNVKDVKLRRVTMRFISDPAAQVAALLSGVYGQKAYDLTVIAHVEPLDFGNFARPNDYWGYESAEFNALWDKIKATIKPEERNKLMGEAQKLVAREAVAAYL